MRKQWSQIPSDTDVLVTHGPPHGENDVAGADADLRHELEKKQNLNHVGCIDLKNRVEDIRPLLHVFGHIHEAYGMSAQHGTVFVNASSVDANYNTGDHRKPVQISIPLGLLKTVG